MPSLATRRLISASATLDPADRALLNLWVNRGLDDHALSRLTGISPDALHSRRDRIVQRLAAELGLPPADVRRALDEIAASTAPGERADDGLERVGALLERHPAFLVAVPVGAWAGSEGRTGPGDEAGPGVTADDTGAASANGHHAGNGASSDNGAVVAGLLAGPAAAHLIFTGGRPVPAPAAPPIDHLRLVNAQAPEARPAGSSPPPRPPDASPPTGHDRRRRSILIATAVLLIALVAILIAALSGGSATPRHRPSTTTSHTTPAAAAPTVAASRTTPASASAPVIPGSTRALGGLPGGLSAVHGAVALAGSAPNLELRLTVSALPAVSGAHYEAWLFNSVVDSQPLGAVPAGASTTAYPLPASAARYEWIDISLQPTGVINHSGESQLRAANPARHRALGRARGHAARRSGQRRRSPRRSSNRRMSK
ncbi:MAG: hypothetical protein ABSH51_28620 [Solirubrobacteraceae bacterium]|jgi:hypothetical protein